MIVPIIIDTTQILDTYSGITHEQVDAICDNIAKTLAVNYASQLEKEADKALHQTRRIYKENIRVVDTGRLEGTVILDFSKNPLVRMIEEGASAFDMKEGMLRSQKAKVSKNGGRYITIPFRFGTPGAIGDSDVFSTIMPDAIYEVAKEQVADIPNTSGLRSSGLTVKQLPTQYQSPATRKEIKDSQGKILFAAYTHKSSIYEGLMKYQDKATGQNTYGSFRRISEELISADGKHVGSDPDSWINKGIERYNLVQEALNNFDQDTQVTVALNNEFEKLGLM
jgi:hypothetical protein